jgi:hypothetical protein
MKYWIRKGGKAFGLIVFFIVAISQMARSDIWMFPDYLMALIGAFAAGVVGWFIGTIVCDILLKGIIADFGDDRIEGMVEGGMVQRLQILKEQLVPGGAEMPFTNVAPPAHEGKNGKKTKG